MNNKYLKLVFIFVIYFQIEMEANIAKKYTCGI